jgi:hypothetical protein
MSTALERIMRERGDCACFHEPFMYDYYVHRAVRTMPHFDVEAGRPTRYEDIRAMLLDEAQAAPVFFKDMSYYVVPALFGDTAFARRLTHAFLVRDPLKSIPSYHRLDPDVTCEEIGIEAQWRHFDWLRAQFGITAPVLRAEDVQRDPHAIVGALWRAIGLDFRADAFDWSDGETPEDWSQVAGWHGRVSRSRSICGPAVDTPQQRRDAFDAIARTAPKLNRYLEHHEPFYDRLCAHALRPD